MNGGHLSRMVLSTATIVAAACAFIVLERRRPYAPAQALFRPGFVTDLFWYTLVQSQVLGLLIGGALAWLNERAGGAHATPVGAWPFAVQLGFFVLTHDLYIYGFHRLQHRVPLLWRTHEAHHSSEQVDWLAGSRSHPLEILVNQSIEFAPMVLLGASPGVVVAKVTLDAVWGMFIHANIDAPLGRLAWLINGPLAHHRHHARRYVGDGANFGTKLAVWDHLFGTACATAEKPASYGLDGDFPRTRSLLREGLGLEYFAQVRAAFRRVRH
jgi:sterol desaturase/sphingolipid hydroxylase (fatty acid hydroxylase superfamily)